MSVVEAGGVPAGRHFTQVGVQVRRWQSERVATVLYTHVTDAPHTAQEALDAALEYYDRAAPVELDYDRVLGAIIVGGGNVDER